MGKRYFFKLNPYPGQKVANIVSFEADNERDARWGIMDDYRDKGIPVYRLERIEDKTRE